MSKKSFYLSRDDLLLSEFLRARGFERTYSILRRPDFVVIPDALGVPVSPILFNDAFADTEKEKLIRKDLDYLDFNAITAAKLEELPILAVGRGMQLLHVHNGGTLVEDSPESHRQGPHELIDAQTGEDQGVSVFSNHPYQYVDYEEVETANLYEEVMVGPDGVVETFYDWNKLQLGVQFPIHFGLGTKVFETLLQEPLFELLGVSKEEVEKCVV